MIFVTDWTLHFVAVSNNGNDWYDKRDYSFERSKSQWLSQKSRRAIFPSIAFGMWKIKRYCRYKNVCQAILDKTEKKKKKTGKTHVSLVWR